MNIDLKSLLRLDLIRPELAIADAVVSNKEPIIGLNDMQLDKGMDANDASLGRYKNFKYKGRFTPIDLKLHGDFRSTEDILVESTGFRLIDEDFKTPFLQNRYGKDIIGLSTENQAATAYIIKDDVIRNIQQQLNGY
jgi:hypothetical protein